MKLKYEELTYKLALIILTDRCAMYNNEWKKRTFPYVAHSRHSKYNNWTNNLKNKITHGYSEICFVFGSR